MSLPQEKVDEFWSKARQIPFRGPVCGLVHRQVNAATNFITQNPLPLRILGSAERRQVEELFHAASYAPQERLNHNGRRTVRRGSGAGRSSIFHGKAWQQLTVVRFEREPGTISAFAFLDLDEGDCAEAEIVRSIRLPVDSRILPRDNFGAWAASENIVFKAVRTEPGCRAEAGLAMLSAASSRNPMRFVGNLFVFLDLVAALKIQLKWMHSSLDFLPVVVARDDQRFCTRAPWERLATERPVIVIAQAAEPAVFRQARLADGQIYHRSESRAEY